MATEKVFMAGKRYTDEFNIEAVRQVTEHGAPSRKSPGGSVSGQRIMRRIYPDRAAASSDVFDYIEMFYNPVRRQGFTADLSRVEFERRYAQTGS
jgi:hypothetical protein